MQAVVLAAGKSSRFWPFNRQHKSLFKIMGRPLIWYTVNNLSKEGIREIIIVQSSVKDIERELKKYPVKAKLKYVVQSKAKGTGDALSKAEKLIKEDFVVVGPHKIDLGDYLPSLLKKFKAHPGKTVLLGVKTSQPWDFGIVK